MTGGRAAQQAETTPAIVRGFLDRPSRDPVQRSQRMGSLQQCIRSALGGDSSTTPLVVCVNPDGFDVKGNWAADGIAPRSGRDLS